MGRRALLSALCVVGLLLLRAGAQSQLYSAPTFCVNAPCEGGTTPSFFDYVLYNGTCNCSAPILLELLLVNPQFTRFTSETSVGLRTSLGNALDIRPAQVWVQSANSTLVNRTVVDVELFPANDNSWTLERTLSVLVILLNNGTILGPNFGTFSILNVSVAAVADGASPPSFDSQSLPPLTPPSIVGSAKQSSSLAGWAIGYICLGAIFSLLLFALLVWWLLSLRSHRSPRWYRKPISTYTSGPLNTRGAVRSTSTFGQKVQEYFVREIPLDQIMSATDNFSDECVLGVGGYGTVYKGRSHDDVDWAVKRAKRKADTGVEDFQNEVDVISKMSHRNLVRLLGYCDEKNEQILVYEYVARGTLRQHLKVSDGLKPLNFQQRLEIAIGAAEGLRYLHSFAKPPIIHRDVKSDNILLDNELQAKVADFGVFKHLQTPGVAAAGGSLNTKVVGTPGYLDPEYYQTYKVTAKSDVYSFGVVLLELITGQPSIMADPTAANENVMVTLARWAIPKIAAGRVDSIVDPSLSGYPRQALQMLGSVAAMCVRRQGRERPEMAEVATRLNEIKYFLQPSSGILSEVPLDEPDGLGAIPEFMPESALGESANLSTENTTAPVSMVFSDR